MKMNEPNQPSLDEEIMRKRQEMTLQIERELAAIEIPDMRKAEIQNLISVIVTEWNSVQAQGIPIPSSASAVGGATQILSWLQLVRSDEKLSPLQFTQLFECTLSMLLRMKARFEKDIHAMMEEKKDDNASHNRTDNV